MKTIFGIVLLMQFSSLFCQEIRLGGSDGYAFGKMETSKRIMAFKDFDIGIEFPVKNGVVFNVAIGFASAKFSYDSSINSFFNTKSFFKVAVSLKKYYMVSPKSHTFLEFGILNSNFIKNNIENTKLDQEFKTKNLGYNLGLLFKVGFKTIIAPTISFDVGLGGETDYILKYKRASDKISLDKTLLFVSFYKKLGK